MFGGLAFLINGNMSVAASGRGGLMVRVPPDETEKLLARDHVEPMVMAGAKPAAGCGSPRRREDQAAAAVLGDAGRRLRQEFAGQIGFGRPALASH